MSATPLETDTLPTKPSSLRSALLVALGVGALSVLVPRLALPPAIFIVPTFIAVVIVGVMPFFAAGVAARLIARRARSAVHQKRRYADYLWTALYRLRFQLAVLVGLIPWIAIQGARAAQETMISVNAGCLDGCMWPLFMPEPDIERLDSLLKIFFTGWGIGHLGVSWIAATLGTSMALWRRRVGQAVLLSVMLMLFPLIALYLPLPNVLFRILEVSTDAAQPSNLPLLWAALYGLAPFVLGLLIMRLAQTLHNRSGKAG